MSKSTVTIVGLVKDREKSAIIRSEYIFETIENIYDFDGITSHIEKYIDTIDPEKELIVFGGEPSTVSNILVEICAKRKINLGIVHYDLATLSYQGKRFIFK